MFYFNIYLYSYRKIISIQFFSSSSEAINFPTWTIFVQITPWQPYGHIGTIQLTDNSICTSAHRHISTLAYFTFTNLYELRVTLMTRYMIIST